MLLLHIFAATVSLGYSTFAIFRPDLGSKNIIYLLGIFTVISGGILAVYSNIAVGKVCMAGFGYLVYTGISWLRLGKVKL